MPIFQTDGTAKAMFGCDTIILFRSFMIGRSPDRPVLPHGDPVKPQLITDFTAYNTGRKSIGNRNTIWPLVLKC